MNATDDWYDVRRLGERSTLIQELGYRMYLLEGDERALLLDAGCGVGDLTAIAADLVDVPVRLLVTHSHWDHIGNAAQFDDVLVHPRERAADGSIAIDGVSDEFVHRPAEAIATWREDGVAFPDDFDPETYGVPTARSVEAAYAGDVLDLGDREVDLLALPGHSPGQLGVLDRTEGIMYGADAVGRDRRLLAHFEHAELPAFRASLQLLADLRTAGAFDTLMTAHNDPMTGDALDVLDAMAEGLAEIRSGDAESARIDTPYGSALEYSFSEFSVVTEA